jgi:cytochrome oxidase Cu insertion factor (SCO1/SenC/PrrC family)
VLSRLPLRLPATGVYAVLVATLALVTLSLSACGSGGSTSGATTPGSATGGARFDGAALPSGLRAPDFALLDQSSQPVSLGEHRGQVVALAFISTACRACALIAQQVRGALDELGATAHSVQTIFVSTDPRSDTPARVARFLSRTSLAGRADYLSSPPARLRTAWHAYGIAPFQANKAASEAATSVLLIDRAGFERVAFGLEQITPETLAHDMRALEAS